MLCLKPAAPLPARLVRAGLRLVEHLESRRLLADTFSNAAAINIPGAGTEGVANPYPSQVNVVGLGGVLIAKATVTLHGLSHASPDDLEVLLVAPTGHSLLLMSDVGGGTAANDLTLTFDDAAPAGLADNGPLGSGTFRPTNAGAEPDVLPTPAPPISAATRLSVFNGSQPNGVYRLYVHDDAAGNTGVIGGGWSLTLETRSAPAFGSGAAINVPGASGSGPASPYPSTINVAGVAGTVTKVTVTLRRLSHTFPDDVDVMLEAPDGTNLVVMADVGGGENGPTGAAVDQQTFTFDDAAPSGLPDDGPILGGVYRQTNAGGDADTFPAPAPPRSIAIQLAVFNGIDPNGAWRLWVADDAGGEAGAIAGGWVLRIENTANTQPPVIANVGQSTLVYTENAGPITAAPSATVTDPGPANLAGGNLNVSFATGGTADDRLAVRHQGNGAGQIGVAGSSVTFGGAPIGTQAGGAGTDPLVVSLLAGATAAAVQALVRNVTFSNVSDHPSTLGRSIRFALTDGDGIGGAVSRNAAVVAVNDAPAHALPAGPHVVPRNGSIRFSSDRSSQVTIVDPDAGNDDVEVTVEALFGRGLLTLGTTAGLTFTAGDGIGDGTFTFLATVAEANAALDGLRFTPTANAIGSAVIAFTTNDRGHSGGGGELTHTDNLNLDVPSPDFTPPVVTEVLLAGGAWTADFINALQSSALGSGGFLVPGGAAQLAVLPWINVDRVIIRFSEDVNVQISDLQVRGVTIGNYGIFGLTYSAATHTATWLMSGSFPADKILLDLEATAATTRVTDLANVALDGEWANAADAYPSGDGTAGGDFQFRVDILPGDVNRNGGIVNSIDVQQTRLRQFTSPTNPGTPPNTYTPFHDLNGSGGIINSLDLQLVRIRQFTQLPAGNPSLAAPPLFARTPIGAGRPPSDWEDLLG